MSNFKCGVVSVSFRQNSIEEIIQEVKKAGLSCIEWGTDVHACPEDENSLNKIVSLQSSEGIETSSSGTYFRFGATDLSELESYINAAKKLGTDILRLWCGTKGSAEYTKEETEILFEECRKAAEIAEKNNIILCMECHPNTYTDRKDAALKLMESVNSSNFKMYWQPNQFESLEENIEYIRLLKPYITHIHVFNWEGREHYPLKDNPDKWVKYLGELGCEERTLLLEFMPDGKIESLKEETETLKRIICSLK